MKGWAPAAEKVVKARSPFFFSGPRNSPGKGDTIPSIENSAMVTFELALQSMMNEKRNLMTLRDLCEPFFCVAHPR